MSVSSHLAIDLAEYDARIQTFIPNYTEMLTVAAGTLAVSSRRIRTLVDLGTGTGALAARAAEVVQGVSLVGIDADPGMLTTARRRLRRRRVRFIEGSFLSVGFPRCDAITASFALHHVESRRVKRRLYSRARDALRPGGLLVTADCHPASHAKLAAAGRLAWRDHLAGSYGRTQAEAYLRAWSGEDFYVPLDVEVGLMRSAGLRPEVAWRRGSFAVIAAWK
jgi:ubiquinone/menaquinone biosynthesis C-methylase UbiE